jgi:hypothetical protein
VDTLTDRRASRPGRTLAIIAAAIDVAFGVLIGVVRAALSHTGQMHAEGPLPTIALTVLLVAPAALVVIGLLTDNPVLFGVAGIGCGPLVFISVAAVPIWLPGALMIAAYLRARPHTPPAPAMTAALTIGFPAVLIGALVVLLTHYGQYSGTYQGVSEGGDYILPSRAAWAIGLVAIGLAAAALAAASTRESGARTEN